MTKEQHKRANDLSELIDKYSGDLEDMERMRKMLKNGTLKSLVLSGAAINIVLPLDFSITTIEESIGLINSRLSLLEREYNEL